MLHLIIFSVVEGDARLSSFIEDVETLFATDSAVDWSGDLNMSDVRKEETLIEFIASHGLTKLIDAPTHRSGHLLDLILTNEPDRFTRSCVPWSDKIG